MMSLGMKIVAQQYSMIMYPLHMPTIFIVDLHSDEIHPVGLSAMQLRVHLAGIYWGHESRVAYEELEYGHLGLPSAVDHFQKRQETVLHHLDRYAVSIS